jgi:hypothetical protein
MTRNANIIKKESADTEHKADYLRRITIFAPSKRIDMDLPKNPMMLLSVLNQKLRDFYPSLHELCDDLGLSEKDLITLMSSYGFMYNENTRQFR